MAAIRRSSTNRNIAGVIGGIAEHFGWAPSRARVAYVLLSILSAGFPGVLVYLVLWFLMPTDRHERPPFGIRTPPR